MKAVRWTLAIVVLALSAVALVAGVVGRYVRTDLLNTDSFVAATAPLATDPAVRTLIADQVTTQITTHLNAARLQNEIESTAVRFGLPAGAGLLAGVLAEPIAEFVRPYVEQFLASAAFAGLWATLLRVAHTDVVHILTGTQPPGSAVTLQGNAVQLDLGPVIGAVRADLVADGYSVVGAVPDISTQLTLVRSDRIVTAQRYGRLFTRYANWLPIAGVVLLIGGLLLVPRRRIGTAIWLGLLAVLLGTVLVGVPWGRRRVEDELAARGIDRTAAIAAYDSLVHALVVAAWIGLVVTAIGAVALVVATVFGHRPVAAIGDRRVRIPAPSAPQDG